MHNVDEKICSYNFLEKNIMNYKKIFFQNTKNSKNQRKKIFSNFYILFVVIEQKDFENMKKKEKNVQRNKILYYETKNNKLLCLIFVGKKNIRENLKKTKNLKIFLLHLL